MKRRLAILALSLLSGSCLAQTASETTVSAIADDTMAAAATAVAPQCLTAPNRFQCRKDKLQALAMVFNQKAWSANLGACVPVVVCSGTLVYTPSNVFDTNGCPTAATCQDPPVETTTDSSGPACPNPIVNGGALCYVAAPSNGKFYVRSVCANGYGGAPAFGTLIECAKTKDYE